MSEGPEFQGLGFRVYHWRFPAYTLELDCWTVAAALALSAWKQTGQE